ncbi:hypothetical protein [Spirilliplanes yamanashiensis]|uniref:Uncharacterized protein n=1 Tax=Spirilliplanes yamanashiensis TaxID=42233 RepID=A0A8J3YB13_9ACTN|nr:hypothetical protein [Spirilliplanes yamanashiensis]MDP9817950.1 putative ATPase [Spirilliplanes yamanashiensis]GIJ04759.1 hypothetical protein Sya03_41110 [Spirilliplanes yamanashiensis]
MSVVPMVTAVPAPRGEAAGYRVPPLAVPAETPVAAGEAAAAAVVREFGALALFERRAREADRGFAVTAELLPAVVALCRRVGGVPLAIELVAARADRLGPAALLTALGADGGDGSLRAVVAWSAGLLSPLDRAVLGALAGVADGWTIGGAAEVTGLDPVVVAARLDALAGRALLVRAGGAQPRYALPEPVRAYLTGGDSGDCLAEADAAIGRADSPAARALLADAVRRCRAAGDAAREAAALHRLGRVELFDGRPREAAPLFGAAAARHAGLGRPADAAESLEWAARAVVVDGPELAARLLGAADVLRDRHGLPVAPAAAETRAAAGDGARAELGERGYARAVEAGRAAGCPAVLADLS